MDRKTRKVILLTGRTDRISRWGGELKKRGFKVSELSLIEPLPPLDNFARLDRAVAKLDQYDWIIFTSVPAVDLFFERWGGGKWPVHLKVATVGEVTRKALEERKIEVSLQSSEARAEGLLDLLAKGLKPPQRILFPQAEGGRRELSEGLRKLGHHLEVVTAYRLERVPVDQDQWQEKLKETDYIIFNSPSGVRAFVESLGPPAKEKRVICTGPTTQDECKRRGIDVAATTPNPYVEGLIEILSERFD